MPFPERVEIGSESRKVPIRITDTKLKATSCAGLRRRRIILLIINKGQQVIQAMRMSYQLLQIYYAIMQLL
jgi:hypothetical protein